MTVEKKQNTSSLEHLYNDFDQWISDYNDIHNIQSRSKYRHLSVKPQKRISKQLEPMLNVQEHCRHGRYKKISLRN